MYILMRQNLSGEADETFSSGQTMLGEVYKFEASMLKQSAVYMVDSLKLEGRFRSNVPMIAIE